MTKQDERVRRQRRKEAYHLSAGNNKLAPDADDTDFLFRFLTEEGSKSQNIVELKANLIHQLALAGGESDNPAFLEALDKLTSVFDPALIDLKERKVRHLSGMWLNLTRPKFSKSTGLNEEHEYMYTLGRMSFDMFRPSNLVLSIQGTFNPIHYVSRKFHETIEQVPKSLKEELYSGTSVLRSYDVVTACTIEPDQSTPRVKVPIKALMTTYGYTIPDPCKPNRLSVWFTSGSLEVNDDSHVDMWKKVFGTLPQRELREKARLLGARIAVGASPCKGMEEDGKLTYVLNRPLGGHGQYYVDILYLDETMRIIKGSDGDISVFARVPHFPDE